ncbi:conserved hypothetical protein [Leishmania mexicana MHOM/GT/2001/U1103]|uniref:Uncharacterized protein n=1 Tax=Leishmania mexicana (strain MHOM/GT/2001/U1103) TaxID=929439 RepID=E9APF7_LEIMU|nr:conserved hypothetical protein [Leishmania mexicana MHOM/GT/2001/U1103]CBZ24821.1 conserved hypothetical protein [Leishmania mexicana MHOM/GT/2001/U1103]
MGGVDVAAAAAAAAESAFDGSGQAQQAASLFVRDVKHVLRWHAVATGIALAATPVVYQVARVVAHRYRAELVNLAKDAVQREELFDGAEADGVLIDPAEEGGISISYKSNAKDAREAEGDADDDAPALWARSSRSSSQQPASIFALRVGHHHSWVVSPFAYQVLAAQRAPNVQFIRTCSRAAVCQYGVVVLRAATTSCLVSVASFIVLYAGCRAVDYAVPFGAPPAVDGAKDVSPRSLLSAFASDSLFTTAAPPSPAVNSTYGLYSFGVSAAGVWSRLFPCFGAVQTLWQRLAGFTQPLHAEWRNGSATLPSSSPLSSQHALADSVWASLSPRGYFIVSLLPRLPLRIAAGLWWLARHTSTAETRGFYAASSPPNSKAKTAAPTAAAAAAAPPLPSASTSTSAPAAVDPSTPALSKRRRRRQPTRLIDSHVAKMAAMLVGDVTFAGIVFLATSYASSGSPSPDSLRWPLVLNDANTRYDIYCWAQAICSTLSVLGI